MLVDLKDILTWIQGAAVPLLTGILVILSGLRKDLTVIRITMAELKTWKENHEQHCTERHELHRKTQNELWSAMHKKKNRDEK